MRTLSRFDPLNFSKMQEDLNRWFDDRFSYGRGNGESFGWTPPCDIFEDSEGVTLSFDLPEVDPKVVDIRLEDGILTIRGERKLENEKKRESYHRIERSYGTFTRSFSLPATLDFDKVRAESKNGVLRIFLPKRAEARPKSVQVKVAA